MKNSTLPQLFLKLSETEDRPILGWIESGELNFLNTTHYYKKIKRIALALEGQGLKKGDHVAIFAKTSIEWHLFDMAIMCSGLVSVPVYPNIKSDEAVDLIKHSDAKLLFVDTIAQLQTLGDSLKETSVTKVVTLQDPEDNQFPIPLIHFSELLKFKYAGAKGSADIHFRELLSMVGPNDYASIVYTSGTTGQSKGAMISHEGFVTMLHNVGKTFKSYIGKDDRSLIFLPLSHVLGRCDSLLHLTLGIQGVYAESLERVIDNLPIVKPSIMIAVPRIFEKIYEKVNQSVQNESFIKKEIFNWATSVSKQYFSKIDADLAPTTKEIIQKNIAYNLVFNKIYQRFGGKIRFFVSGGASLSDEIIKFLRYANLTILEGYGLTETIAPCLVNPVSKQFPGTVGLPIGDVKISFADDGEILIKSKAMFEQYYKNSEATKDTFNEDGWFKTGDIGELNSAGYLKITDRKKDLIITSGGKNVAPQKIEGLLKLSPHILEAVVIGEKRKYLTALISINKDSIEAQLKDIGYSAPLKDLIENQKVLELIGAEIENANKTLANYESIKKFKLLPDELTIENGSLTPSLKIKRKFISLKYKDLIDSMY